MRIEPEPSGVGDMRRMFKSVSAWGLPRPIDDAQRLQSQAITPNHITTRFATAVGRLRASIANQVRQFCRPSEAIHQSVHKLLALGFVTNLANVRQGVLTIGFASTRLPPAAGVLA